MIILDFEKNRVGLGEKINSYGARLLDSLAPSPIDNGGDNDENKEDSGINDNGDSHFPIPDQVPKKRSENKDGGSSGTGVIVFIFILLIVLAAFIVYIYLRKKK